MCSGSRAPPRPNHDDDNAYVFERSVTFHHPDGSKTTGRIDLYKRGCFVLEAKQGVEKQEQEAALSETGKAKVKAVKKGTATRGSALWDEAMLKAQGQADQYARSLPASEGRPPLLIVVDVGHSIELYAEFTCTGGAYVPFPDPRSHRILIDQLSEPEVREKLRLAWTDPKALDPARRTARVTREIAEKLGLLAQSLEKSKHSPEAVATFLMRALFTMFAEDVELLPKDSFITLLKSLQGQSEQFVPMVEELWRTMKTGGFSTVLRKKIALFNGGLFENVTALPLTEDQFELLIEASKADWRDVEPAIFGTLLERALNPIERHKLGAHYTPRAYVERLVVPTIVEPLRAEWDAVKAAAVTLGRLGKAKDAVTEVQRFHTRLCELRVLDPACGSGNFLYVTLEHLKRLEGDIVKRNYAEWFQYSTSLLKPIQGLSDDEVSELDRLILNFLSSARSLIDHFAQYYKQTHRNTPEEEKFSEYITKLETQCWAFAFFQDLRNFTQHCGLPTGLYSRTASRHAINLKIVANAKWLLNNYAGWGKSKLSEAHGELDLIELTQEYHVRLNQDLGGFVARAFAPTMIDAHNFFASLAQEVETRYPGTTMAIAESYSIQGTNIQSSCKYPPADLFGSFGITVTPVQAPPQEKPPQATIFGCTDGMT